jgi:hypothetical protein
VCHDAHTNDTQFYTQLNDTMHNTQYAYIELFNISKMQLSILTLGIMTLGILTQGIMTFRKIILRIVTSSIKKRIITLSIIKFSW